MRKRNIAILLAGILTLASGCQSNPSASATPTPEIQPTPSVEAKVPAEAQQTIGLLESFSANPYQYKAVTVDAFSNNAADAPTDEDLTAMMKFAMAASSAHGLTPAHFVVVRDVDEQTNILSGLSTFGLPNPASAGTVTVLVFGDTIRDQEHHAAEYNGWYSQMYYGIYDSGAASAYLGIAAQTMGYGIHQVAGLNIPLKDTGTVEVLAAGGNFSLVNGNYWDADKYLSSQDGSVDFTHVVSDATMDGQEMDVKAKGNLTLLSAMVIGGKANTTDATSGATMAYPDDLANFNFWDPQDGSSYGTSVPAGEDVASQAGMPDLSSVADGTYTGKASSTSSEYTVAVEVKGGAIASLEISEGKDNMRIGAEDLDAFLQSIVSSQSLTVDAVSGATEDCAGIISAIRSALAA